MNYYYMDLFSGIGGFALSTYWAGMKFHGHYFSEVDEYAIGIYKKRFPDSIPLGDVRTIKGQELPKGRWLITGGFPCQDISVAGNKAGLGGERSGLFSEYIRIISEIRPAFAIMENVGNLASWFDAGEGRHPPTETDMEGGEWRVEIEQYQAIARCIGNLSEIGYDSEWAVIRASDVGAPHRRDRFWIVGYPCGGGLSGIARRGPGTEPSDGHLQLETRDISGNANRFNKSNVADSDCLRLEYEREVQDRTGEQNLSSQSEGSRPAMAHPGHQGIHQQGISSDVDENDGQQRRIYGNGLQGSEGEERISLADSEGEGLPERGRPGGAKIETETERGMVIGPERCSEALPYPGCFGLETSRTGEQTAGFGGCSEEFPNTYIFNDDASGYGTGPVCGERSPEAEIPRGDTDTDRKRCQEFLDRITAWAGNLDSPSCRNGIGNFWAVEPNVGRVANGVSSRVDRLKGLGNSVVPQIPQLIIEELKEEFYNDQ